MEYALRVKDVSKVYRLYSKPVDRLKESLSPFKPTRKFQEGDIVWVVGEEESLDALLSS
jgi:CPA2 family monovalent cation:H+ antiporter-2